MGVDEGHGTAHMEIEGDRMGERERLRKEEEERGEIRRFQN